MTPRDSGVLLHVTSLPGGEGIGDLGQAARVVNGCTRPAAGCGSSFLGPAGPGWSPYQSPSTFAGHPLLISLQDLVEDGWLRETDLDGAPPNGPHVDFPRVSQYKTARLRAAAERWRQSGRPDHGARSRPGAMPSGLGWTTSRCSWH
jgi:4-alpha-glucanotransferase